MRWWPNCGPLVASFVSRRIWDEVLQSLADAGDITRASVPKLDWTWRVKGLGLPEGTAERVLEETRGERYPMPSRAPDTGRWRSL